MTEFVNVPKAGLGRDLIPQAIVLLDPSDGSALGSAANPVHVLSTSAAAVASADRELLVTIYRCKTAFGGATVGDTITATRVLDVGGASVTQVGVTLWRNETSGADLASIPAAVALDVMGTPGLSDAQLRASPVPVSVNNLPATQAIAGTVTANVQGGNTTAVKTDGSAVTQPVSGTVAVSNLPATQTVGGTVAVSNFPTTQAVSGTFWQATQPVSATALPLPAGAATAANQPALVAGRMPVDGSGVTQPISATALPLPAGAATAANQATEITSLGNIDTKLTKGTAAKAASLSVTFASDAQTDTIGRVGALCAQPTASAITCAAASAYASGNAVGGLVTITGAVRAGVLSGLLQSVKVTSASAQAASTFDVFLFSAAPTAPTDKTAYAIATADLPKLITVVHCTDTITAGGTVHLADRCAQPFLATATSIYAVVVVRGTPTFAAATDVALSIAVVQD